MLKHGMSLAGISQSELSRISGVPQSKISRYVRGVLEPSTETLARLLDGMGVRARVSVESVGMERSKRRSWLLHRRIARKLSDTMGTVDWSRMQRNLDRVREGTQGQPHERNMDRWQQIITSHDLRTLRRVLVDPSTDGIEMREVSPMTGFLTEGERLEVLAEVRR